MSSLPWSVKGTKAIPVEADKFLLIDSEDVPGPTQNKTTTLDGITSSFTASKLLRVKSQADLEAQFGSDIIIPDGEIWTLKILESFTLSKPIKIGAGSSLQIRDEVAGLSITYTGTGDMIQNENSANPIGSLAIFAIRFSTTGSAAAFDIVGNGLFRLDGTVFVGFESLGTIESMFGTICFTGNFNITGGITFINPQTIQINNFNLTAPANPSLTFITIISTGNPSIRIENCSINNTNADVLFIDPSSGDGSRYSIQNIQGSFNNLFVPGTDQAVSNVVNGTGGQARFQTSGAHGLVVGDRVVLSGFLVETSYNKTDVITSVPTASEFMLGADTPFTATDTGNVTQASRDSTDVTVRAINNTGSPDSMFTGDSGLEIFGSPQTVTISATDTPEVIVNAGWAFNNLERFSEGISNQGQLIADDAETRRYRVNYSASIEKLTGGSVDVGIVLLKNGSIIGFNPPHTSNAGVVQIVGTDIIELTKDDTLDIAVINYGDTNDIRVSQAGIVVSLG